MKKENEEKGDGKVSKKRKKGEKKRTRKYECSE